MRFAHPASLLFVSAFAVAAACGNSDSADDDVGDDTMSASGSGGGGGHATGGTGTGGTRCDTAECAPAGSGGTAGGAGGTTGGTTGAAGGGGTAGAGAAGASGAAACPYAFCDDFEASTMIDTTRWAVDVDATGSLVEVQSMQVAHGKNAAHFHVPAKQRHALLRETATVAALPDHVYGRASFYLSPNNAAGHTDFFLATNMGFPRLEIGEYQTSWQINYQYMGGESPSAAGMLPANKWVCVAFEFERSPDIQISLAVDGMSVGAFPYKTQPAFTVPFTDIEFGVQQYGDRADGTDIDVYMDDIALDGSPIACNVGVQLARGDAASFRARRAARCRPRGCRRFAS